jgi:imidazolonepropionase-like amidohydrolase
MVNWQGQQEWRSNTLQPFLEQMIQSLHVAGVPILIGTDTGVEGALPTHVHRELELLVRAGLSPYEALSAATKNARLSVNRMGVDDVFGEVIVGQRADLLLLKSNPLENVGATRHRLGVMSRGRWYTQAELDDLVGEVIATY